jgi:phytoene desaturase
MKSIVIGSGFGGIAAALRLKAKNHNVTLIEKHPDLGGRARVFKKNGFTFDAGPTVITAPDLIEELFALFNKKAENYIKLTPHNSLTIFKKNYKLNK